MFLEKLYNNFLFLIRVRLLLLGSMEVAQAAEMFKGFCFLAMPLVILSFIITIKYRLNS